MSSRPVQRQDGAGGRRAPRKIIPDKLYFKIGEVSELTGVKPYILRYWESEFKMITPAKTRSNQRLYKRSDVELILQIKQMLYGERYTIAGAKQRLRELRRAGGGDQLKLSLDEGKARRALLAVREELKAVRKLLE